MGSKRLGVDLLRGPAIIPARTPRGTRRTMEATTMAININNALDKAYEGKSLKELCDMPLEGLQGISEEGATKVWSSYPG